MVAQPSRAIGVRQTRRNDALARASQARISEELILKKLTVVFAALAATSLGSCARSQDAATPAQAAPQSLGPRALEPGLIAPEFSLPDQDNKTRNLKDYRGKTVILAFYPADMTGGCTLEARGLTQSLQEFVSRNVQVFGISVQDVASKKKFCETEGITYPLLADVEKKTAANYGVLNGGVSDRVTFLIAPDGTIAAIDRNVNVASHAEDLLKLIAANKDKLTPKAPPMQAVPVGMAHAKVTFGQNVVPFSLPNYDGKTISVGAWNANKTKATLILWVSTKCPYSNGYNARMKSIADKYAARGVRTFAINSNKAETPAEIAAHAKANKFAFPVLKDAGNSIADRFDAKVTPEAFLIDSKGMLRYHGYVDDSLEEDDVKSRDLQAAIDALLAGRAVKTKQTLAFGCGIKRVEKK